MTTLARGSEAVKRPRVNGGPLDLHFDARSARRQRLATKLHASGPRPVLEALIAVAAGARLDDVLEDFGRLPVEVYLALGADVLPIDSVAVIDGGRR
jgi:hypothetical protein